MDEPTPLPDIEELVSGGGTRAVVGDTTAETLLGVVTECVAPKVAVASGELLRVRDAVLECVSSTDAVFSDDLDRVED